MTICDACGREFTPDPRFTISDAFLKLTSWRRPFLGYCVGWLLGGIIGIIGAIAEAQDARLRFLLIMLLVVIVVLALDVMSAVVLRSGRAMRYCRDCNESAEASRGQRPEERRPHKIAVGKHEMKISGRPISS